MDDDILENTPDLGAYRNYPVSLARLRIRTSGPARLLIDPSDVVQQTLLAAYEAIGGFRGSTSEELCAWLRRILARKIIDAARKLPRPPEKWIISLDHGIEDSARRLEGWLASDQSSPLSKLLRNERSLLLSEAMAKLPEDQRSALECRYLLELSISEIAELTGRSGPSVAGLLRRGLKALRALLDNLSTVSKP